MTADLYLFHFSQQQVKGEILNNFCWIRFLEFICSVTGLYFIIAKGTGSGQHIGTISDYYWNLDITDVICWSSLTTAGTADNLFLFFVIMFLPGVRPEELIQRDKSKNFLQPEGSNVNLT